MQVISSGNNTLALYIHSIEIRLYKDGQECSWSAPWWLAPILLNLNTQSMEIYNKTIY